MKRLSLSFAALLALPVIIVAGPAFACQDNAECAPGWFCAFPLGVCGGIGTCWPRPEACPAVVDPVCGCDGNTYGNACDAASFGMNIDFIGECSAGDDDDDGYGNTADNCQLVANPGQRDTDGDGIGNDCDPDVAPPVNDCIVNFLDLQAMQENFLAQGDLHTDLNGDGITNFSDVEIMRNFFFGEPGPGLVDCEP